MKDWENIKEVVEIALCKGHPLLVFTYVRDHVTNRWTGFWAGMDYHAMVFLGMTDKGQIIVADSVNRDFSVKRQRIKLSSLNIAGDAYSVLRSIDGVH